MYFCHNSIGVIDWNPGLGTKHYEPNWAIVLCDPEILHYYTYLLKKYGIPIYKGSTFGAHISLVIGEDVPNKGLWGVNQQVSFNYAHLVRMDNGRHIWLDVQSEEMNQVRLNLGLPPKPNFSFHLTIGRLF